MQTGWRAKGLHGKYTVHLSSNHVDLRMSSLYPTKGYLISETEGFITATQEQVIATRNYRRHILKEPKTSDLCRLNNNKKI